MPEGDIIRWRPRGFASDPVSILFHDSRQRWMDTRVKPAHDAADACAGGSRAPLVAPNATQHVANSVEPAARYLTAQVGQPDRSARRKDDLTIRRWKGAIAAI